MALTRTFLAAPIKASDLVWSVGSTATGFPGVGIVLAGNGQPILVDSELAFLVTVLGPTSILVRSRGSEGTLADIHDVNAAIYTSAAPGDFPPNVPGAATLRTLAAPDIDSYGQSGPVQVVNQDTKAFLTGTSAITLTLQAPSLALTGTELVFTNTTPFAHVINGPGQFDSGSGAVPFSNITFNPVPGSSVSLVAQNGLWNVQSFNNVTFS